MVTTIWYLIIFGLDWNTSQAIPEPTQAACMQQAAWVNTKMQSGITTDHAFCVSGLPR